MNIFDLIKCLKILYGHDSELKKNIYTKIENCSIKNLNNLYKEIYKRIIIPLYIPLLIMIPFLLITSSKENKDYTNLKINTFIIGLSLIIFSETTIRFISKSFLTNLSISVIPILIIFILNFYFQKKFNLKLKS